MNAWRTRLAPILFAVVGVLFLIPVLKDFVQGESIRGVFPVIAFMFLALAVALSRKGGGGPGQPRS